MLVSKWTFQVVPDELFELFDTHVRSIYRLGRVWYIVHRLDFNPYKPPPQPLLPPIPYIHLTNPRFIPFL